MLRSIQLITLDCALVVAEEGSFLAAARRLRIHHSALSRRIKNLELTIGVTLFERHPGGVKATASGGRLLASLRRILGDLDDALASVDAQRPGESGPPSIGLARPIRNDQFLDAVVALMDDNPCVAAFIEFLEKRYSR